MSHERRKGAAAPGNAPADHPTRSAQERWTPSSVEPRHGTSALTRVVLLTVALVLLVGLVPMLTSVVIGGLVAWAMAA
jgi:hypothetical protein